MGSFLSLTPSCMKNQIKEDENEKILQELKSNMNLLKSRINKIETKIEIILLTILKKSK